jgi:plastocyanin
MIPRILVLVIALMAGNAAATANWQWVNLHPAGASESFALGVDKFQESGCARVNGQDVGSLWTGSAASWVNLHPGATAESWSWGVSGGVQVGYAKVGSLWHAALWTGTPGSWVDLHPGGNDISVAYDVAGGQQVGVANNRAALWTGTAASYVSLHPSAGSSSVAFGTDGARQVGYVSLGTVPKERAALWTGTAASWVNLDPTPASKSVAWDVAYNQQAGTATIGGVDRAIKWSGTATSWIDLHPTSAAWSVAYGVSGGYQAGVADFSGLQKAALWSGTAASFVDLHAVLPSYFFSSEARDIYVESNFLTITIRVVGRAWNTQTSRWEAILWFNTIPRGIIYAIAQVGLEFQPSELRVKPGDVIQWIWTDGEHTVTSGNGCEFDHLYFDEPLSNQNPVVEFVVPAGVSEIPYFCRPHCGMGMTGLIIVEPAILVGDLNCDGVVSLGDINPFVLAMSNLPAYQTNYPDCPFENRDINGDGVFDFGDINPFVRLLTGR